MALSSSDVCADPGSAVHAELDNYNCKDGFRDVDLLEFETTTARLRLRALRHADRDAIFAAFTADVTRFMEPGPPRTPDDSARFVAESRERMRAGRELVCAVLERGTARFLGCAGLHELDSRTPELGIWIAADAQGAGLGREAVAALVAWGSARNRPVEGFRYPVDRANAPSRRLAEALGGRVVSSVRRRTADGRTLRLVVYRVPPTPPDDPGGR